MKLNTGLLLVAFLFLASVVSIVTQTSKQFPKGKVLSENHVQRPTEPTVQKDTVGVKEPPASFTLPQGTFVAQTFNNCGPASLSITLSMYGKKVSQEALASEMRPFNNPEGGVDDKSIFAEEFVHHAERYGFKAIHRPSGTIEQVKRLVANGIPVVVRTWLNPVEDIGHFRVVRGYNSAEGVLIVDDSYNGPNLSVPNNDFMSMWRPFNYGYILIYPEEKQELVEAILGENYSEKHAWMNAKDNAEKELSQYPDSPYDMFNLAVVYYHLGEYEKSVAWYEKSLQLLPGRMLWYQLEPIEAYLKLKKYDKVFSLTDDILYNGNLAYSELYQMRGEAYLAQGQNDAARKEFEKAVYYNKNFLPAQKSLREI